MIVVGILGMDRFSTLVSMTWVYASLSVVCAHLFLADYLINGSFIHQSIAGKTVFQSSIANCQNFNMHISQVILKQQFLLVVHDLIEGLLLNRLAQIYDTSIVMLRVEHALFIACHACFCLLQKSKRRSAVRVGVCSHARQHRSSSPHILAHTLDPVTQVVDACIPLLQSPPHVLDLLHVQHLWLYPVDPSDLSNLVDRSL